MTKYDNLISLLEISDTSTIEKVRIFALSEVKRLSGLDDFDKAERFKSCTHLVKDRIYYHAKYTGLTPHDFS